VIVTKDRQELEEFEQQQKTNRLEMKRRHVRSIYPNMSETAVKRMAKTMLELDAVDCECHADEFDASWHNRQRIAEQKERILAGRHKKQSELSDFQADQEARIEAMCAVILDSNPDMRQKVAAKDNETENPDSIDYRDPDNYLRTKLHQAVYDNMLPEVRELVNAGASTDIRDSGENTPFMLAIREEYIAIAEYLKDK
jgi:ankyrin repeat protein